MKILNAKDLNELREIGYTIYIVHSNGIARNSTWINPKTFWNCLIFDGSKKVEAHLYKYLPNDDRSNVKLIRY